MPYCISSRLQYSPGWTWWYSAQCVFVPSEMPAGTGAGDGAAVTVGAALLVDVIGPLEGTPGALMHISWPTDWPIALHDGPRIGFPIFRQTDCCGVEDQGPLKLDDLHNPIITSDTL